jgi:hypothetical protein
MWIRWIQIRSGTLAATNANGGDGTKMATTEHDAWSIDKMAADLSE